MDNTRTKVYELIGQASVLFRDKKTNLLDGVFDEKQANEIAEEILALIKQEKHDLLNRVEEELVDEPAQVAIRPQGYKPPHSMQKVIKARHRNQLRADLRHRISDMRGEIT